MGFFDVNTVPVILVVVFTTCQASVSQPTGTPGRSQSRSEQKLVKIVYDEPGAPYNITRIITRHSPQTSENRSRRAAAISEWLHWRTNNIPFEYENWGNRLIYRDMRRNMRRAMKYIESRSCVRFTERKSSAGAVDFLVIAPNSHYPYILSDVGNCGSAIGWHKGPQLLLLGIGCLERHEFAVMVVVHELLHAVGLIHEHQRSDRDEYVDIKWDNIQEKARKQFIKIPQNMVSKNYDPYDYGSIMHYSSYTGAINDTLPTILAKGPNATENTKRMGDLIKGMSEHDVKALNDLFACESHPSINCTHNRTVLVEDIVSLQEVEKNSNKFVLCDEEDCWKKTVPRLYRNPCERVPTIRHGDMFRLRSQDARSGNTLRFNDTVALEILFKKKGNSASAWMHCFAPRSGFCARGTCFNKASVNDSSTWAACKNETFTLVNAENPQAAFVEMRDNDKVALCRAHNATVISCLSCNFPRVRVCGMVFCSKARANCIASVAMTFRLWRDISP